jgi:hypothetical protein
MRARKAYQLTEPGPHHRTRLRGVVLLPFVCAMAFALLAGPGTPFSLLGKSLVFANLALSILYHCADLIGLHAWDGLLQRVDVALVSAGTPLAVLDKAGCAPDWPVAMLLLASAGVGVVACHARPVVPLGVGVGVGLGLRWLVAPLDPFGLDDLAYSLSLPGFLGERTFFPARAGSLASPHDLAHLLCFLGHCLVLAGVGWE